MSQQQYDAAFVAEVHPVPQPKMERFPYEVNGVLCARHPSHGPVKNCEWCLMGVPSNAHALLQRRQLGCVVIFVRLLNLGSWNPIWQV